jgi:mannose-6-phosphate isomerase-like protein (cupin superfamily)
MNASADPTTPDHLRAYRVGDRDSRPWGTYEVMAAAQYGDGERVEKMITILPRKVLSLQSHRGRSERWTAVKGTFAAVLDSKIVIVLEGDSLDVPAGTLHALASLGPSQIQVHEVQTGKCRESDIERYADHSGRDVDGADNPRIARGLLAYRTLVDLVTNMP